MEFYSESKHLFALVIKKLKLEASENVFGK